MAGRGENNSFEACTSAFTPFGQPSHHLFSNWQLWGVYLTPSIIATLICSVTKFFAHNQALGHLVLWVGKCHFEQAIGQVWGRRAL
jgi:hypothetical protein